MDDRQRDPYQTPPPSPYRSPPHRILDISPPKGASSRPSQLDPRAQRTSSTAGPRASSVKKEDQTKGPQGSRYAINRPAASQRVVPENMQTPSPHRIEPLNAQPLRFIDPLTMPLQKPTAPPSTVPVRGKSTKGPASKADLSKNHPTKRKASDMSPPKIPSSDPTDDSDTALLIRSVTVGKKKVTFKHVDHAAFKAKH
ncbi:proline-rich receptor-like protein kinase PERK8 [Papaver somniferum]|uniref:proline-rich receptor-like protein kinase PERK8 n=1 Tax=Papaver somniferum TaxID=3469 RepID=UPI000E704B4B|nr:proline-rich receptor-like protein kinase PERK8 [Papaver somniferum]